MTRHFAFALAATGFLAVLPAPPAAAQPARTGEVARFVEWVPHPGAKGAFAEGYGRHLEWHRRNRDPWTWHGWWVATGDRLGTFVDASFGHSWEALDHSIAPAQDSADNAANVTPHADATLVAHLVRLPEHSVGDEAAAMRAPMLATLRVLGDGGDAAALWAGIDRALGDAPRQAYRLVGGTAPSWLVAIPHADWRGFGAIEAALARWRAGTAGVEVRIEVLRRDAGMSHAPAE